MEVSGHLNGPAALLSGKKPGTHWIGGWVGDRDGLNVLEKKISWPYRDSNSGPFRPSPSLVLLKLFFLAYHCHNTIRVHVTLGTANINEYFQDTGLPGCFTGWQVWNLRTWQSAKQQRCGILRFRSCYFSNLKRFDDRGQSVFIF